MSAITRSHKNKLKLNLRRSGWLRQVAREQWLSRPAYPLEGRGEHSPLWPLLPRKHHVTLACVGVCACLYQLVFPPKSQCYQSLLGFSLQTHNVQYPYIILS